MIFSHLIRKIFSASFINQCKIAVGLKNSLSLELERISKCDRLKNGKTNLICSDFEFIDSESFINQYIEIFQNKILDFHSNQHSPKILDCGSNIGEIYYAFIQKRLEVEYCAFEPDPSAYKCLAHNLNNQKNINIHPIALSNNESESELYIDGFGGNSSLEYFGSNQKVRISTKKLDSFNLKKIKLFKVEAEGHEEEVLKGSTQTFPYIEFISVDYGPEKGESQESTMTSVIKYLSDNNFELIQTSKYRQIGLFKNKKLIDNSK